MWYLLLGPFHVSLTVKIDTYLPSTQILLLNQLSDQCVAVKQIFWTMFVEICVVDAHAPLDCVLLLY
jgi:hypothetical protein